MLVLKTERKERLMLEDFYLEEGQKEALKTLTDTLEEISADAVGLAWDGCHKIYVIEDEETFKEMKEMGFGEDHSSLLHLDELSKEGEDVTMATLAQMAYLNSCPLRFVNRVYRGESGQMEFADGINQADERFEPLFWVG